MIDAILDGVSRVERGDLEGYPVGWYEACYRNGEAPVAKFDSPRRSTESVH